MPNPFVYLYNKKNFNLRRQVKDKTLLLSQASLKFVQNTSQRYDTVAVSGWVEPRLSQRDDTVAVSGWFEPRPEDKSKI